MNKQLGGLVVMTVFLYIMLSISSAAERYAAVAVGSHYSHSFATEIQQIDKARLEQLHENAAEAAKTGQFVLYARRATRAVISLLVSASIFFIAHLKKRREPDIRRSSPPVSFSDVLSRSTPEIGDCSGHDR